MCSLQSPDSVRLVGGSVLQSCDLSYVLLFGCFHLSNSYSWSIFDVRSVFFILLAVEVNRLASPLVHRRRFEMHRICAKQVL